MAAVEFLVFLSMLTGVGFSAFTLFQRHNRRSERNNRMHEDLRKALQSHDYKQLDDFLVLWGDDIESSTKAHVQARRDELYIEAP
jgi:hypothetical protein